MKDKTPLEKIADGIEQREELKRDAVTTVKMNRLEEWNEAVEESPYNEYFGLDMACAIAIMKARKKGLKAKDAVRISEHHYKVPAERTSDLLYRFSDGGEKFYNEFVGVERKHFCKKLINSRKD
jgi:hypothetical protein